MDSQRMVLLMLFAAFLAVEKTDGLIHIVGGVSGWDVPSNATFYKEWAKPRTFGVGDELVFPFRVGAQTVIQVNKKDFDTCGRDNVINEFYDGPIRFKLDKVGDYYFYCDVGLHCEEGQKLAIKVVNGPGSSGKFFGRSRKLLGAIDAEAKPDAAATKAPAVPVSAPTAAAGPNAASGPTAAGTDTPATGGDSTGSDSGSGDKPAEASAAVGLSANVFGMTTFVPFVLACTVVVM